MDQATIIGCAVLGAALAFTALLTFWSRRRINRISQEGHRSAREIVKGFNGRR